MPFGKYKGTAIEDIPSDYLLWMAENLGNHEEIQLLADREYSWREKYNEHFYNERRNNG
jgi:hypothetical protein